jgi:Tfp pilus assembly protein PilX
MTLMIALIMLMVITLFAVSMVRLSSINIAAVGNMQAQKVVESEAEQAVEIGVGKFSFFEDVVNNQNAWAANKASLTYAELWTNYRPTGAGTTAPATQSSAITVSRPQCIYYEPASGYSALSGVAPQDTYWDMQVTATDSFTGATTEVHQGLAMRLPAGNCP